MIKQFCVAIFLALFLGAVIAESSLGPMVTNSDLSIPLLQHEEQQWHAKRVVFAWSAGTIFAIVLLLGRMRLSVHFRYAAWGACIAVAVAVCGAYVLAWLRHELGHKSAGTAFQLARHFLVPMFAVVGWGIGATIAVMRDHSPQTEDAAVASHQKG
jgi:hypothetical protein